MSIQKLERRLITTELRAVGQGKNSKIAGYAARFNSDSEDLGGFIEQIAPGAFTDALADPKLDAICLFNHDGQPLGRTTSGTMKVTQDSVGLFYECTVPDTQLGRDILTLVERGDISQSSFGFAIADGGDVWTDNYTRRLITKVACLFDCSPVGRPAYEATSVEARSKFLFPEGAPIRGNAEQQRSAARVFLENLRGAKERSRTKGRLFLDRLTKV
jgi:uncharacterized protein